jgi:hypothetical protein
MSRRVAITGVGLSDTGRVESATPCGLIAQSSQQAMSDAGLVPTDIDGFCSTGIGVLAPVEAAEFLGIRPR